MADDYLSNLKSLVGRWKKTVSDPSYRPSDDENQAEKSYYSQLPSAMVGSIAPIDSAGGILGEEVATAEPNIISNQQKLLEQQPVPEVPNMFDVQKAQQAASRAIDMADRNKAQLSAARKAALDRMRK